MKLQIAWICVVCSKVVDVVSPKQVGQYEYDLEEDDGFLKDKASK